MKNVSAIAAVFLLGGCSLINSFDDLKPQASDGGGAGGGKGSGGAKGSGGSAAGGSGAVDSGAGGTEPIDASSSGGAANTGGAGASTGGAPDEDVFVPGGPGGAIVVYQSTKAPAKSVVWVLDPTTGAELSETDSPNVAAIVNDPATDNWYFFETSGPAATTATLRVRALSLPSGQWRDVGTGVTVPVPVGPVSLLTGGLAYLSGSSLAHPVTILNTANQLKIKDFADVALDSGSPANAVLDASARLGIIAHPSAKGGTVTVVLQEPSSACVAVGTNTLCNIDLLRVSVDFTAGPAGAAVDNTAPVTVGRVNLLGGNAGFAADNANDADIIILPSEDSSATTTATACSNPVATTMGTVQEFNPNQQHQSTTQPLDFTMGSTRVSGAAFDYCQNLVYATSLIDQVIWGVPTSGSPPPGAGQICKTKGGYTLVYEPYTRTLLRVANDSSLESYFVTGSAAAAPTFKSNTNFTHLPAGFSVLSGVIAVRTGSPVSADSPTCGP